MPEVDPLEEREGGEAEAESASLRRHLDPAGVPSPDLWRQAIEDFNDMEVEASGLWQELGPSPLEELQVPPIHVSGTVTDIAVDPSGTADDQIYIATIGGGIWQ